MHGSLAFPLLIYMLCNLVLCRKAESKTFEGHIMDLVSNGIKLGFLTGTCIQRQLELLIRKVHTTWLTSDVNGENILAT